MAKQTGKEKQSDGGNKLQELLPPGREPIHQGQQFDELQRQHKNPDGSEQKNEPGAGKSS
jgi:hypothetical protein